MTKTSVLKRPDNLSSWVLLTHPATPPGTVRDFLKKTRAADRPFIRINYYKRYKYRYIVECDLLEGLLHGYNMGFTMQGIAEVERIIASLQHKTYCTFCAGNCYAYARYLSLEDAVEVANALAVLADMGGMWDSWEKTLATEPDEAGRGRTRKPD